MGCLCGRVCVVSNCHLVFLWTVVNSIRTPARWCWVRGAQVMHLACVREAGCVCISLTCGVSGREAGQEGGK
jgi:hypothetical protein